jgi:hypothetical protein
MYDENMLHVYDIYVYIYIFENIHKELLPLSNMTPAGIYIYMYDENMVYAYDIYRYIYIFERLYIYICIC